MTALPNVQVLDLANSYHDAAEVLSKTDANAIPIVNLRCHAIELFLKSLHLTDIATDVGDGIFLLTPGSGQRQGHRLQHSFDKALQQHRDMMLSGMPDLREQLACLEGAFQKSRYLFENGGDLPLAKAASVSGFLAYKLARLPRLTVPSERA